MLQGFKEFITRGNVLDLAVAVVIGAAFSAVVNGLVDGFIMPLISWLVGAPDFSGLSFKVPNWQGETTVFPYGLFVQAVIMFLLIAAAIYFFVIVPINKLQSLRKKPEEVVEEAAAEEVVLLTEIRDLLRAQSAGAGTRTSTTPPPVG